MASLVKREAYFSSKDETHTLFILHFTLHEIRFTRYALDASHCHRAFPSCP